MKRKMENFKLKSGESGGLFSAVKQKIHFYLISSSEFLPALSQFPVPEFSGRLCETLCEVFGTFDLRFCFSPPFEQKKKIQLFKDSNIWDGYFYCNIS